MSVRRIPLTLAWSALGLAAATPCLANDQPFSIIQPIKAACALQGKDPVNPTDFVWQGNNDDYTSLPKITPLDPIDTRTNGVPDTTASTAKDNQKTSPKWLTFVYDTAKVDHLEITQAERHTRIYQDISALVGKLVGPQAGAPPLCTYASEAVEMVHDHATLTVVAMDTNKKALQTVTVVYGPAEHLFLGLDLPVNSRKTLKYDATSKSLLPQDSNPQLFLSLNALFFGDLASPQPVTWGTLQKGLSGKLLFSASSRPLDDYGVGIGLQLPKIEALGLNLNSISIFGAFMWIKQDAVAANGASQHNGSTAHGFRVGISYDLGSALKYAYNGSSGAAKTTKTSTTSSAAAPPAAAAPAPPASPDTTPQ